MEAQLFHVDIDHVSYLTLNLPKDLSYNLNLGRISYTNLSMNVDHDDRGVV